MRSSTASRRASRSGSERVRQRAALPPVTTALAIVARRSRPGSRHDRAEFGRFVPPPASLDHRGSWLEAREALQILRGCGSPSGRPRRLRRSSAADLDLDQGRTSSTSSSPGHLEFIAFAKTLGDSSVDWLCHLLSESDQRRTRRLLAEAVAQMCRDNPERLAPWLADRRWYVVRNMVHILGWIGGPAIVPLLQATLRHPEPRVRQEIVARSRRSRTSWRGPS